MSRDYFPKHDIPFEEMLQRVPTETDIKITRTKEARERNAVVLFDGEDYVWAFRTRTGSTQFTTFGRNDGEYTIATLAHLFATDIQSEDEVRRWREKLMGE